MIGMRAKLVVAGGVLLTSATLASATITTTFDATTDSADWQVVGAIAQWATTSALMEGMLVTVNTTTSTETVQWGATGAVGSGWSVALADAAGSTYSTPFQLTASGNTDILSLLFEGAPGGVVFDVNPGIDSSVSTANSLDGVPVADSYVDFQGVTVTDSVQYSGIDIAAHYYTPVALTGSTPLYDLYSNLLLTFTSTTGAGVGFTAGDTLSFISDTDNTMAPVPEPAAMLLFGAGLAGLGIVRASRKRS